MILNNQKFLNLIRQWKHTRDIAVKIGDKEIVRALDLAFPYLLPEDSYIHNIKQYTKEYKHKNYHPIRCDNDLSIKEAFNLELEAYKRVSHNPNFPRLLYYDVSKNEITLEHCGPNLDAISNRSIIINNAYDQIKNICITLQSNNIFHLDIQSKNLCYKNNTFYLIDFDMCVLDNKPLNKKLKELYDSQKKRNLFKILHAIIAPKIQNII